MLIKDDNLSKENPRLGKGDVAKEYAFERYAKEKLETRVFIGTYSDMRLCKYLDTYRDAIIISEDETDFKRILECVIQKLKTYYSDSIISTFVTGPLVKSSNDDDDENASNYILWTDFVNVPVGSYWFMIQEVTISQTHIMLNIKPLRPFQDEANRNSKTAASSERRTEWGDVFKSIFNVNSASDLIQNTNMTNITYIVRFLLVFLLVSVVGLFQLIQFLSEFLLKLLREFSDIVHKLTPVTIAVIDMIGKLIGGFYMLLAMLFRGQNSHPSPFLKSISGSTHNNFRKSTNFQKNNPKSWKKFDYD